MNNKKMENSVKSLTSLYTVVIGVALSLSIASLIDPKNGLQSITLSSVLLFLAFIATLFPFFHGALRHLDDAYIENDAAHIREGALVLDFLLLFVHGIAFVVLALLLNRPGHFAWVLVVLLSIDVVWAVFVYFAAASKAQHVAEGKWAVINGCFVGASVTYLVSNDIYLTPVTDQLKLSVPILFACVARTVWDYVWGKDLYFPKSD